MLVALQVVAVAAVPLNLTVLVPCVAPKFAPVIVTDAPTNPDVGFKLVMLGAGTVTVKAAAVAGHSANRHHHVPCRRSRWHRHYDARGTPSRRSCRRPVELDCAGPLRGAKVRARDRHRRTDQARCRIQARNARRRRPVTVKATPLLATPPTVTTTFPVVAPVGTGATMLVALQARRRRRRPVELDCAGPLRGPKVRARDRH